MRLFRNRLSLLLALTVYGSAQDTATIQVAVTDGPSKSEDTKCHEHAAVEMGDIAVIHFNISYHESSPSGTPGGFITSSDEHSEDGDALAVPLVKEDNGWELALVGYCEEDRVTLTVPPENHIHDNHGFLEGKNVPEDAILKIDIHVADLLIDDSDEDEDFDEAHFNSGDFEEDEDEEEEEEEEEEEL